MWQKIKCFFGFHSWTYFTDYNLDGFDLRFCEHCRVIEMTNGDAWYPVGEMDDFEMNEILNHPDYVLNDPATIFKPVQYEETI